MSETDFLSEIRRLNISYMLLVQKLITADPSMAEQMLNIDRETAEVLAAASCEDMATLSQSNQLLCQFALNDSQKIQSILQAGADDGLRGLHASIVMDSRSESSEVVGARRRASARNKPRVSPAAHAVAAVE